MEHIFKRKLYDKMLDWKQSSQGRSALLIQGARRVGKSTIAEQFAKNEYESHILIDFSKCSKDIRNIFDDISDLDFVFNILWQTAVMTILKLVLSSLFVKTLRIF